MLYSDMTIYALLIGVVIPLLVALLTKLNASSAIKAILNFGLSALSGVLVTINQTDFHWKPFLINFAFTWVVSVATYYGLLKPAGITQTLAESTSGFGIG